MSLKTNFKSGISAIHDNLLLKDNGDVFAMFEVPKAIINSIDRAEKDDFKALTASALAGIEAYKNFDMAMIPIDVELDEMFLTLSQDFAEDTEDLAWYILDETYARLQQSVDRIFEYHWYVSVPLKSSHISFDKKAMIKTSLNYLSKKIVEPLLGKVTYQEDWYLDYEDYAKDLEKRLSLLNAKPLNSQETIFINGLQYLQGLDFDRAFEMSATTNTLENLDDTTITWENMNILTLHNGLEKSYLAMLPVAYTPENISYLHLMEDIQGFNFPIPVLNKGIFSSKKGTFSVPAKANRARLRHNKAIEDGDMAGGVDQNKKERSKALVEDLLVKSNDDEILLGYLQTLAFADNNYEALVEKMRIVMDSCAKNGVELVKARADQLYLFYKNRFTETLDESDKNFIQITTLDGFVENLFFAGQKVGQDVGFYIGRIDSNKGSWYGDFEKAIESSVNFAYVNPFQANKLGVEGKVTSSPHTAIIGDTGNGKSFLTKYLFLYSSLLKAKTLYIDPKAEMRHQCFRVLKEYEAKGIYPEIQDYIRSINFVTLDKSKKSNWGALDPLVFLKGAEAKDLAISMTNEIYKLKNKEEFHSAFLDSLDKHLALREKGEKVGMLTVFRDLEKHKTKAVRISANLLVKMVQNSILSLCFSDGQNQAVDTDRRITVLEVTGLDLPTDEKDDLSDSQIKSLVVMYALGHYCHKFGSENRKQETIIFMDEAWFFNATAVGRGIIKRIKRVGRSENNFLVLITQSVDDTADEDDGTGFGTIFAFNSDTEAEKVLTRLKIPVTAETISWFESMTMGQCIFRDTFGRSERITVDGLFPEINVLFDTVETDMKAVA
ncbi:ATP-binding protein [Pseudolactococcus yaeyamensis]